jgi:FkbH-like protein
MKFAEALKIANASSPPDAQPLAIALVCGCTPHHLQIFLTAHLRQQAPARRVRVEPGLYGDCLGNLERAAGQAPDGIAVLLEWADIDPRLGLRQLGGWGPDDLADIAQNVRVQAARFQEAIARAGERAPVALCLPTLPLPPVAYTPGWQMSAFEVEVRGRILELGTHAARQTRVRLVHVDRLAQLSPPADRLDVKSDLLSGFPYRPAHASALSGLLARLLLPAAPKKGIITDLDDTLWRGILGEAGVAGVTWGLDKHSHTHALYQQLLRALAESGVLVAVASKNDPALVEEAFRRDDILLPRTRVFPLEAHWQPKSESVGRVLQAWNIAADSVVFIDDSPIELAEVQTAHPGIEAILFPKDHDQAVVDLLIRLRDLFGKGTVGDEDRLRLDSLRRAAEEMAPEALAKTDLDAFLRSVDAEVTITTDREPADPRALELVNKTNQFNLNGRRFSEAEWQARLQRPGAFLHVVSYKDRFGPLGKIAVLSGRCEQARLLVDVWVMSCRAFSRRIEHQCLAQLLEHSTATEAVFDFQATARNGPLQEFFTGLLGAAPAGELRLGRAQFASLCPPLYHRVRVPQITSSQ